MTKSTITRERLEELAAGQSGFNLRIATHEESQELACMALAAMDSESVILYRERNPYNGLTTGWQELTENELSFLKENAGENAEFLTLYRHAQSAPERDQVRSEHAEWSQATFGNVGPVGPLNHLSKEALEAAAEPSDLSEWADMQFLLWDAQRRAGITDEQITQAMIEKLAVNKQREWPEPKDGEPRLHIKAQPAPVVPEDVLDALQKVARIRLDLNGFDGDRRGIADCLGNAEEALIEVVNRRAAMLQAEPVTTANKLGNSPAQIPIDHGYRKGCECSGCKTTVRICAELAGNSPVIPDTWIPVSERLPEEGGRYWCYVEEQNSLGKSHYQWNCSWNGEIWGGAMMYGRVTHWMPLPNPPKEVK